VAEELRETAIATTAPGAGKTTEARMMMAKPPAHRRPSMTMPTRPAFSNGPMTKKSVGSLPTERTHVERAHRDCDNVSIDELRSEFQNHHTVVRRPEAVPGEIETSPVTFSADELGFQFAIRPDERDKLEDVETLVETDKESASEADSTPDDRAEASDGATDNENA